LNNVRKKCPFFSFPDTRQAILSSTKTLSIESAETLIHSFSGIREEKIKSASNTCSSSILGAQAMDITTPRTQKYLAFISNSILYSSNNKM
jgi:hypothetical protein